VRTFIVGGYIRDTLLGIPVKDKDYVVVGASPQEMLDLGFRPIGQDFPVFLHPTTNAEYALARTERKSGQGYKGFTFYTSKEVTLEQDLFRRDFTVNAMAQEINDEGQMIGPIIDPFGGEKDLKRKVLKHVSPAFKEDPLRILRLARFMAKLEDFQVDQNTMQLVEQMVQRGELQHLVPDRVWLELSKGLLEVKPSKMLGLLSSIGALNQLFPKEFLDGKTYDHTKSYMDIGAKNKLDLKTQFAYLFCMQEHQMIQVWSEKMRVPNEIREFAQIFANFYRVSKTLVLTPEVVMQFFDASDAWRKSERLVKVLDAAKFIELPTESWKICLDSVQQVDAGAIAKTIPDANGPKIQEEVSKARFQAVFACL
jgi:tRNA nucleotidyltransferase (CCA-adding enzyme)